MAEPQGEPIIVRMTSFDRTTLVGPDINHLAVEVKCAAPAPLVVNGASYVGCQLVNGHDGQHSITIKWGN